MGDIGTVGQGDSRLGKQLQTTPFPPVAVQSGLWPALLAKMKIDPEAFITRHLDQIIPRITTQSPLNQVMDIYMSWSGLRGQRMGILFPEHMKEGLMKQGEEQ